MAGDVGNAAGDPITAFVAKVVWTREALNTLESVRVYIAQFDLDAARRIAARLMAAGDSLSDFPDRGRPASDGTRELVIVAPYVLRYRVVSDTVYIVRVRHGARRPD